VEGGISELSRVIRRHEVEDVLVAMKNISPEKLREIVSACADANVRFQILPSVQDVMSGRVSLNQIRPVEIEDLLGREPVKLELADDANYVRGKTVMITGAGGSIGSELCRQLLQLEPKCIIMFGHGENSIYEITQELRRAGHKDKICSVIGDIRDEPKLRLVVEKFRPQIFFHAAAHKHVPLMEAHPEEAVKNNVAGTRNVARLADEIGAERFIMISSDKAVRSTNVMGATKRLAEMIVFCMAQKSKTLFTAVRFGNVLGSRGSVVPLFRNQIAAGGPVTITSPDVTRYFMTIPEAVSLVIQAGSMNQQRRLFLLDMGKPVRIVDLARNLIRLSGFEPDRDIEIVYTGLRPGEKLKEELLTEGEDVKSTGIGKIFMTEPEEVDSERLREQLEELEALAMTNNADGVKEKLRELVPDYGPEELAAV
jgi:FlaA1/EpsC-like NDP-sugar epimerase